MRTVLLAAVCSVSAFAEPRLDSHGDPLPDGAIARFGTIRDRIGSSRALRAWTISPDGKTIVTEDSDGIVHWDVQTGRPEKRISERTGRGSFQQFGLACSPD